LWRYTGMPELWKLGLGIAAGSTLTAALILGMDFSNFPRSVLILHPLVVLIFLGGARATWRYLAEQQHGTPGTVTELLILGSLQDASAVLKTIQASRHWSVVGIVSPHAGEVGRLVQGVPVLSDIPSVPRAIEKTRVKTGLIACPHGSSERQAALQYASEAGMALLTMPRPDEWLRQQSSEFRKIDLEDLLGRQSVKLDDVGLSDLFAGQCVMVTGAGGSIGSELCRQIARFGISRLICVDCSEYSVYALEQELRAAHPQLQIDYFTANVRESDRLRAIFKTCRPALVFHAAAYKHVPLMEQHNEIEAIRTNILGTLNTARLAGEFGARRFVLISTDKAVNPTNVMGATKRIAEQVGQSVAQDYPQTEFVSVRFGNVLGSSGSVVPLFTQQIAQGGPITVTHPDIVRYFMTIPEAARLVLQASLIGRSGMIYVLDMGEPVKITDLAKMMIRLSGKSEQEISITYTGLRPGEKLYEELLADDETTEPTPHPKLRIAKIVREQPVVLTQITEWLDAQGAAPDSAQVRAWLRTLVPEYSSHG
jgi:FlaA1/EpsC-like NDP-sugar epimerase